MISINKSKFIKSLKIKKYRTLEKCFLVEGRKNVREALLSHYRVRTIVGTSSYLNSSIDELKLFDGELLEGTESFLTEAGTFQTNQDCLAVVEMKDDEESISLDNYVFLLDGIGDPGNLGTIIRTLDWFGFTQVVCSLDTADCFNPKVINASMGSFFRVAVHYANLAEFIETNHRPVIGAEMEGAALSSFTPPASAFIVMGSESHGLSALVQARLSHRITIPRIGGAESLNVGVATGIIASHFSSF